jgi:peptide/nickel transport system substrate-binding protein
MITTDTKSVSDLKNSGFKVIFGANTGGTGLVFSSGNQKSPFADVRVRQAASYAVDCESLVQSVLYGQFQYTNQPVWKGNWGYNASVAGYPYNPDKAKSLLAEAGYAAGFNTEISYIAGTTYERINTAVQRYLAAVNIKATLAPNPPPKLTQISKVNGWDGMTFMGGGYHTDLLVTLRTSYGTIKGFSYASMITPDDYLAAVTNGIKAPDQDSKQKYAQEAMKLMIDKYCLVLPISTTGDFCIPQSYVRNLGWLDTSADTSRWNLADAWISK